MKQINSVYEVQLEIGDIIYSNLKDYGFHSRIVKFCHDTRSLYLADGRILSLSNRNEKFYVEGWTYISKNITFPLAELF